MRSRSVAGIVGCDDACDTQMEMSPLVPAVRSPLVLPHVILLPVASSTMLPGGLWPSPSDLMVFRNAEGHSDTGGGEDPSGLRLER
jgi:hypothetical protein